MKKAFLFLFLLLSGLQVVAFDWKPQTNEALRADMFRFVEQFRDNTSDRSLSSSLDDFRCRFYC